MSDFISATKMQSIKFENINPDNAEYRFLSICNWVYDSPIYPGTTFPGK